MPSMPALVSGGISLGVLAGFLSSVYYVLLAGLKWFGNLQLAVQNGDSEQSQISDKSSSSSSSSCGRCGCSVTSGGRTRRKIDCIGCGHIVCRQCSIRTPTGDCVCVNCNKFQEAQQQTADWFYEQLKQRFFNSGTVAAAALNTTSGQDGEVRDFMESIVEGLVGDGLDNVCLRPVSTHPNYKPLSLTDSPSFIHGELKELIKQIMREATNLPSFHVFSNGSLEKSIENEAGELQKKSYEDILATAILNKVVERHQQGLSKLGSNSQISVRDTNGNVVGRNIRRRRRKYKLTNKPVHDCRRRDSSSDSETNEHFPNSCDDCNWSGSTKSDPLSFTIEECIEEVVTRYSSEDERDTGLGKFLSTLDFKRRQRAPFPEFGMDIVDRRGSSPSSTADEDEEENLSLSRKDANIHVSMEVISNVDSWEENWLFQKKRLKTAGMNHSMPVPMLVPNPSEEYRVLIGDVDADETSDLSECSDSALEDLLDGPDKNASSLHSESEHELENTDAEDEFLMQLYKANKPLIHNGFSLQNGSVLESAVEECEDEADCKTAENCSAIKSKNPVFNLNEAKNNELIVPQVDSGEGSLEIQQDSEYTEAYDSAAQLSVSKKDTETRQPDSINVDSNEASDNKSSNEERRIESEDSVPKNAKSDGMESQNNEDGANDSESENFDLFSAPPRPGTIAEREHKKWLQAVPLTNNPYSKENIERRQRERMLLRRQISNETSVEFPELTGENNASVVPIDCSGCEPNHKQYGRDYYINNGGDQKEVSDGDLDLEATLLRGSVMHIASRVHGSSPNFTMNPLFEDTDPPPQLHKAHKTRPESGYASSVESANSSMVGCERLSSLPEPQVVECTFENLNTLRKSQTLKMKSPHRKKMLGNSLKLGGSLNRLHKLSAPWI